MTRSTFRKFQQEGTSITEFLKNLTYGEWTHFQGRQSSTLILPPSEKGSTLQQKFAFIDSKFYPFKEDPFSVGVSLQESKQKVTKFVSLANIGSKSTKCIQSRSINCPNIVNTHYPKLQWPAYLVCDSYGKCPKISNTLIHTFFAWILLFMQMFL